MIPIGIFVLLLLAAFWGFGIGGVVVTAIVLVMLRNVF